MPAMFMFVTCLWPRKLTKADRQQQQQVDGEKVLEKCKTKSAESIRYLLASKFES